MPHPNVELLDKTLAQIEAHPETWKQDDWRCGTSMCFAGWASALAGGTFADDGDCVVLPSGKTQFIWDHAQQVLGLSDIQGDALFYGGNDMVALRAIVGRIKSGDPL